MSDQNAAPAPEAPNTRALEVLRKATLTRYEHGGGRLYVEGDKRNNYVARELVADFFNEDTRDLIMSLIEAAIRPETSELAIQTRLATDRNRVIGELGQEIERLKACQHDLLLPDCTIAVDPRDPYNACCVRCRHWFRTRAPLSVETMGGYDANGSPVA
jgi:hypothetical protein